LAARDYLSASGEVWFWTPNTLQQPGVQRLPGVGMKTNTSPATILRPLRFFAILRFGTWRRRRPNQKPEVKNGVVYGTIQEIGVAGG
jgi:hypothetical protein